VHLSLVDGHRTLVLHHSTVMRNYFSDTTRNVAIAVYNILRPLDVAPFVIGIKLIQDP